MKINFKNYTGLARIGPIRVHVENLKIGDKLFHALLDNIADHYADLIFGFDKDPVAHRFDRTGTDGRNVDYVEYLFLRRYLLTEDIEGIVAAILRNPHTRMLRETHSVPLAMARATDPVTLLISLSHGDHIDLLKPDHKLSKTPLGRAFLKSSGRTLFPSEVPEERRYHTNDTHENRFAKHVLEDLERRLDDMSEAVRQHTGGLVNPEIGSDLEVLRRKVSGCLDDPLWREVGPLSFLPHGSTVLQRREGYRQLYRLHALLQLVTRYEYDDGVFDFKYLLETKDTATLYEYWCFFQVKEIIDAQWRIVKAESLTQPGEKGIDTEIKIRHRACLSYENGLTLHYNWTAEGSNALTDLKGISPHHSWGVSSAGQLRPDIVIECSGRRLVLDAKNKGRRGSGFFGSQEDGLLKTPKPEDIVKMHAYRDAIKGVKGAFALFPGTENVLYPAHGATQPWNGVGALAFRPDMGGKPESDQVQKLIWKFIISEL